jgi:UDP-glucose 4-epimerase
MTEKQVVLVTGVAGHWGARLAARLVVEGSYHVIGVDRKPPAEEIAGLDFVAADIRNPLLVSLLQSEGVDTLCHLAFVETARRSEATFDFNVTGTIAVLDACAEAGVRKVVLKSSMAVYGARPSNSTFLTENHALRGSKEWGTVRDLIDIEVFSSGYRRRSPEVLLTTLRFPSIVGPTADTPMTRFLNRPLAPSLLGFDPIMQFIHEDDVVEALAYAVSNDAPGVFNVAADDVHPLNKVRGLAGKIPISVLHPFAYWGGKLLGKAGLGSEYYMPLEPDYLRYPWVGDLARMREELDYEPRYTAEETLREFAERNRLIRYQSGSVSLAHEEERLHDVIERRRRAREEQAQPAAAAEEGGEANES